MNQSLFKMSSQTAESDVWKPLLQVPDAPCELNLATGQSEQRWSACRRAPGSNCINQCLSECIRYFALSTIVSEKYDWLATCGTNTFAAKSLNQKANTKHEVSILLYVDVSLGKTMENLCTQNTSKECTYNLQAHLLILIWKTSTDPHRKCHSCFCLKQLQQNNSGKRDRNGRSSAPPLLKLWDLFQALGVTEVQVEIQLRVLRWCEQHASTARLCDTVCVCLCVSSSWGKTDVLSTDQNRSSECNRADQRPGAVAASKLCFLRVN